MSTPAKILTSKVMIALSENKCICFRANVGLLFTKDGRYMRTGLPNGFSDIFGHRMSDGRVFYIEIKAGKDKLSDSQSSFLARMRSYGALAGVARSVEDSLKIIQG